MATPRPSRHSNPVLAILALALALLLPLASPGQDTPEVELEAEEAQTKGEELVERLQQLFDQRDQLHALLEEATGDDRTALEERRWDTQLDFHRTAVELSERITADPEGEDAKAYRGNLERLWLGSVSGYVRAGDFRRERVKNLRAQIEEAPPEGRLGLQHTLSEEEARLQNVLAAQLEGLDTMDSLGLETKKLRLAAVARLQDRAETLAGRLKVSSSARTRLLEQLDDDPDAPELKAELTLVEERLQGTKDHLASSATLLESEGVDVAQYQQLLIESTGEITADVFDPEVAMGLFETWSQELSDTLEARGSSWLAKTFVVLLILIAFRIGAAMTRVLVRRSMSSSRVNVSQLLQQTLISWSSRTVMIIGLLVAVSQIGIEIAPLLAGLGIAGFVIGFALQDSLSNFAAGAMILIYRPFDVGDIIEAAGVSGQVREMSLVSTTIHTFDNQTLIVPNTKLWGDVIRNVTAQRTRRVDLTVRVAYSEDVDRIDAVLRDVASSHEKVLADPEPMVEVHQLAESGVEFIVRPWVHTEDYWPVYWALTREIKRRFDREGITIPFPQRDLHHHYDKGAPPA